MRQSNIFFDNHGTPERCGVSRAARAGTEVDDLALTRGDLAERDLGPSLQANFAPLPKQRPDLRKAR